MISASHPNSSSAQNPRGLAIPLCDEITVFIPQMDKDLGILLDSAQCRPVEGKPGHLSCLHLIPPQARSL